MRIYRLVIRPRFRRPESQQFLDMIRAAHAKWPA